MCIIYKVILSRIIYIGQYISWRLCIFLIFLTKSFIRRWFYVSKYFFHMPVFKRIGGNFSDKIFQLQFYVLFAYFLAPDCRFLNLSLEFRRCLSVSGLKIRTASSKGGRNNHKFLNKKISCLIKGKLNTQQSWAPLTFQLIFVKQ